LAFGDCVSPAQDRHLAIEQKMNYTPSSVGLNVPTATYAKLFVPAAAFPFSKISSGDAVRRR
jgi:hypothetical protein